MPVDEYPFGLEVGRKWRFDWLFLGHFALEIEGGAWTSGRHTRGQGFLDDIEKYNEAHILGYVVIRCTPEQIEDGTVFETLKRAIASADRE